jgi:hypothetical protein
MRILNIISILVLLMNVIPSNAQIVRIKEVNNIKIKSNPDPNRISMLLIIQTTGSKTDDDQYIDAQLKFYDLDLNKITLYILKLADGTCKQGDTEIDFGDFKISRNELNNFLPYKLFIPIPKPKEQMILNYFKNKFDSENSGYFDSRTELEKVFNLHKSISSVKNKTSKLSQDFAIEIPGEKNEFGDKNEPGRWAIKSDELIIKMLCKSDYTVRLNQQLDSINNILNLVNHQIDSLKNIRRNSISVNWGTGTNLDVSSIMINNLINFNFSTSTIRTDNFVHQLGIEFDLINATHNLKLQGTFENKNQLDNNGDLFNGIYNLSGLEENSKLQIFKTGLINSFDFQLNSNLILGTSLNLGILNVLDFNSIIDGGIVNYTGNYPQYNLNNFDESSLGFGNFNLKGHVSSTLNFKSKVFFVQPGIYIDLKLSNLLNSEIFNSFSFKSKLEWLVTEDFISKRQKVFENSPTLGINSAVNSINKFYITSLNYTFGIVWRF